MCKAFRPSRLNTVRESDVTALESARANRLRPRSRDITTLKAVSVCMWKERWALRGGMHDHLLEP